MQSNVEIKAKIGDYDKVKDIAEKLSLEDGKILRQQDTYFVVQSGRMKLREVEGQNSELVFYERPNNQGPKLSRYWKQTFKNENEAEGLKILLSQSLGIRGIVKKERLLYHIEQTRVHLDKVEDLGHFLELEVVLSSGQNTETGQAIASDLMEKLGILQDNLISCSYIDLLINESSG